MEGYIHSTESFGTVDGPGIRFVVFFQGCPLRCLFCHNPDTWKIGDGRKVTADELLSEYKKNETYYKSGGLTVTGGEPLMQIDFLIELFTKAKSLNIHTCLDTSGFNFSKDKPETLEKFHTLAQVTDLVLLDLKHINPHEHIKLTGQKIDPILFFSKFLEEKGIPVWIRHVIVPGITDNETYLKELGYYIGGLHNVKALDVLPYHSMGKSKYDKLGIPYPLKDVQDVDKDEAIRCKNIILDGIKYRKKQ
ncbi:MAG TPA: pyruvate formate lyase-activating protein [Candidatus Merdenecus merdavium]|nr:pyruvate formate lyase-activating protein [Candidatus Merdenecus merdavium]